MKWPTCCVLCLNEVQFSLNVWTAWYSYPHQRLCVLCDANSSRLNWIWIFDAGYDFSNIEIYVHFEMWNCVLINSVWWTTKWTHDHFNYLLKNVRQVIDRCQTVGWFCQFIFFHTSYLHCTMCVCINNEWDLFEFGLKSFIKLKKEYMQNKRRRPNEINFMWRETNYISSGSMVELKCQWTNWCQSIVHIDQYIEHNIEIVLSHIKLR